MGFWLSSLTGLLAGLFGGLVGLGGGVVMVPLLSGWLKLGQHQAHATSLVAVVFTGLLGALAYSRGSEVDWFAVLFLALASTLATTFAAGFSKRVSAVTLRRLFGYLLIITGLLLPLEGLELIPSLAFADNLVIEAFILLLAGVVVGTASGLLGIGGGSIMVPLLVFALGFDQHLAQGTSLAAMIPAGIGGSIVHWRLGHVARRVIVGGLVLGVAAGAWLGGSAALAIPELGLQLVFAAVMVWTGLRYVRRAAVKRAGDEPAAGRRPAPAARAQSGQD